MVISITSSQLTPQQLEQADHFLQSFLPRLKKFPGVVNICHYAGPGEGKTTTLILWESEQALKQYRGSELIKEAIAFEDKIGQRATREAYPVSFFA